MKKLFLFFCFTILVVIFPSHTTYGQYSKWLKDISYQGIKFKKIRFRIEKADTLYNAGILAEKTIIDGYPCHKDVMFSKNWDLKSFILSESDTIAGNVFKKDTKIFIYKSAGFKMYCLYDPVIQTYRCKGTNYKRFMFMGSTALQLYPGGQLKYFQPVKDIEIQGVLCKRSPTWGGIHLYESGKLKECTSAKDQTIDGVFHGKNFILKFDEDGNITYSKKENFF
ncbi:MAG: hypothetical protein U9N53_15450 [Bacteroidota bacterium]|nr:hypothetical protein [Bacteroidota bacterium]